MLQIHEAFCLEREIPISPNVFLYWITDIFDSITMQSSGGIYKHIGK